MGLPRLYLLVAIPTLSALVAVVPPFQSPDEPNHVFRAYQVSRGAIFRRVSSRGYGGGDIDESLRWIVLPYLQVFNPTRAKASRERFAGARGVRWSGRSTFSENPVQASYGPFTYLPQALGLAVGRLFGMRVLDSYYLARILNGATAIALGHLALRWLQRGRLLAFIVLVLPMTLFQFASTSQDALQIASSLVIAALATRLEIAAIPSVMKLQVVIAALAALVALGRPPMIVFALLAFLPAPHAGRYAAAVLAVGLALAAMVGWLALSSFHGPLPPGTDPSRQLAMLLGSASAWPHVMVTAISHSSARWLEEGIGILGWLDTSLPRWFYRLATATLALAIIVDPYAAVRPRKVARVLYGAVFALGLVGVLLIHYVGYTPVGVREIGGVQGRHLLQLVPLLALAVGLSVSHPRAGGIATAGAALFGLTSAAVTLAAVTARYY
jgi:uncharacterized membrane protein